MHMHRTCTCAVPCLPSPARPPPFPARAVPHCRRAACWHSPRIAAPMLARTSSLSFVLDLFPNRVSRSDECLEGLQWLYVPSLFLCTRYASNDLYLATMQDGDLVVRFCKDVEFRSQMGYIDFGRFGISNYFVAGSGSIDFIQASKRWIAEQEDHIVLRLDQSQLDRSDSTPDGSESGGTRLKMQRSGSWNTCDISTSYHIAGELSIRWSNCRESTSGLARSVFRVERQHHALLHAVWNLTLTPFPPNPTFNTLRFSLPKCAQSTWSFLSREVQQWRLLSSSPERSCLLPKSFFRIITAVQDSLDQQDSCPEHSWLLSKVPSMTKLAATFQNLQGCCPKTSRRVIVEIAIPCAKRESRVFEGFTVGFHPRSWEIVYNGLTQIGFEKPHPEFRYEIFYLSISYQRIYTAAVLCSLSFSAGELGNIILGRLGLPSDTPAQGPTQHFYWRQKQSAPSQNFRPMGLLANSSRSDRITCKLKYFLSNWYQSKSWDRWRAVFGEFQRFGTGQSQVPLYLTAISSVASLVGKPSYKVSPKEGLEIRLSGSAASGVAPTTLSPSVLLVNWRCERIHDSPYKIYISIPVDGYDPIEFTLTKFCAVCLHVAWSLCLAWDDYSISLLGCCELLIAVSGPGAHRLRDDSNGNSVTQASWERVSTTAEGTRRTNERRYGSI
ncbi:hypothetical protein MA16_Dca025152 [Dendrobium catenatum]|uniref:Uncharacterized protein n=1 Tax=Dendrobium catenatum TaxID=906689 RepID=A0A2I0VXF0_9ASPA|nr:hypothetical protein MA16_Dca025152 [Dendrobium catenatum]